MEDCIFCKIIKGEIPCYKIYENKYVLAFLDIAGDTEGHTLVIPKKHFVNVLDCDYKYIYECVKAIKTISNHYVNNCGFKAVNILNASGEDAGQTVFHLHFHIMPKFEKNDFDAFPKCKGKKTSFEEQLSKLKIN